MNSRCDGVMMLAVALVVLFVGHSHASNIVEVGLASYSTVSDGGRVPMDANNDVATPRVSNNIDGPIPTNDWASSLVYRYREYEECYSANMYAHPMTVRACHDGMRFAVGVVCFSCEVTEFYKEEDPSAADNNVFELYGMSEEGEHPHFTVGFGEDMSLTDAVMDAFSDWTVTAQFNSGGSEKMKATFGQGLPFVVIERGETSIEDVLVTLNDDDYTITRWDSETSKAPGVWGFTVTTPSSIPNPPLDLTVYDLHWAVFAPYETEWEFTSNKAQAPLSPGQAFVVIALLPDNTADTLELFRQHAYAKVTDTKVSWEYDEPSSSLYTTYDFSTALLESRSEYSDVPITSLFRHQSLKLTDVQEGQILDGMEYTGLARGDMKLIKAKQFKTKHDFYGIVPFWPNHGTYDNETLWELLDEEHRTEDFGDVEVNTYRAGKALGRLMELVYIAEYANHTEARNHFVCDAIEEIDKWWDADQSRSDSTPEHFYYDETWHTLIGYPAYDNSDSELNNHVADYGYFLMTAARFTLYQPQWAEGFGEIINMILKDVANWDREDKQFPFLRNFEIFEGHSWKNGHGASEHGNHMESSSQAINFATGVFLWGMAVNDTEIRDLGIYLYVHEVVAAQQYWFDVDGKVYPDSFDHTTMGVIYGDGGVYSTDDGSEIEHIHAVNFRPIQPGSVYLGRHPEYMQHNYAEILRRKGTVEKHSVDLIWSALAFGDVETALERYEAYPDYEPDDGDSKPHTYHWLHVINGLGSVDHSGVKADSPYVTVFRKNGVISRVCYNPEDETKTTTFNDGHHVAVPGRTMVVYQDGDIVASFRPLRDMPFPETHCTALDVEEDSSSSSDSSTSDSSTTDGSSDSSDDSDDGEDSSADDTDSSEETGETTVDCASHLGNNTVFLLGPKHHADREAGLSTVAGKDFHAPVKALVSADEVMDAETGDSSRKPTAFRSWSVDGDYVRGEGATEFWIFAQPVDRATTDTHVRVVVRMDFDGNGVEERVETYPYANLEAMDKMTDDWGKSWSVLTHETGGGVETVTGDYETFRNGTFVVELWARDDADDVYVLTSAQFQDCPISFVNIPFNNLKTEWTPKEDESETDTGDDSSDDSSSTADESVDEGSQHHGEYHEFRNPCPEDDLVLEDRLSEQAPAFDTYDEPACDNCDTKTCSWRCKLMPNDQWGEVKNDRTNEWWVYLVASPITDSEGNVVGHSSETKCTIDDHFSCATEVALLPYEVKAVDEGIIGCYPRRAHDLHSNSGHLTFVKNIFWNDLTLRSKEPAYGREIGHANDLSVSMRWIMDPNSGDDTDSSGWMESPLVRGSPYITMVYNHLTPVLQSQHALLCIGLSVSDCSSDENIYLLPTELKSDKFVLKLSSDQIWMVYTSSPVSFTISDSDKLLVANHLFTGTVRIAILESTPAGFDDVGMRMTYGSESLLDDHASIYPTSGHVSLVAPEVGGRVNILFDFKAEEWGRDADPDRLLMMTLPHHEEPLIHPTPFDSHMLLTIKGYMKSAIGSRWHMVEELTNIGWYSPHGLPDMYIPRISEALVDDHGDLGFVNETEATAGKDLIEDGKTMLRLARLALIADEIDDKWRGEEIRAHLKAHVDKWFPDADGEALLVYDTFWGGICTVKGLASARNDHGNGLFMYHHHHYGPLLYAAAVLAKRDSDWASRKEQQILSVIRDVANPSPEDAYFPRFRYTDWFAGQSSTTGLGLVDWTEQPGASRPLLTWHAIQLYGLAIRNHRLRDLGRILLAWETRGIRTYYQIPSDPSRSAGDISLSSLHGGDSLPATSFVYPEKPFRLNRVVSVALPSEVHYASPRHDGYKDGPEYLHGIGLVPNIPVIEDVLDPVWAEEEYLYVLEQSTWNREEYYNIHFGVGFDEVKFPAGPEFDPCTELLDPVDKTPCLIKRDCWMTCEMVEPPNGGSAVNRCNSKLGAIPSTWSECFPMNQAWRATNIMELSIADKVAAWEEIHVPSIRTTEEESRTNQLYFIASRPDQAETHGRSEGTCPRGDDGLTCSSYGRCSSGTCKCDATFDWKVMMKDCNPEGIFKHESKCNTTEICVDIHLQVCNGIDYDVYVRFPRTFRNEASRFPDEVRSQSVVCSAYGQRVEHAVKAKSELVRDDICRNKYLPFTCSVMLPQVDSSEAEGYALPSKTDCKEMKEACKTEDSLFLELEALDCESFPNTFVLPDEQQQDKSSSSIVLPHFGSFLFTLAIVIAFNY